MMASRDVAVNRSAYNTTTYFHVLAVHCLLALNMQICILSL